MTNKKAKMFLFIGLIVFFMSVVAVINSNMSEIILIKETYPNNTSIRYTDDFAFLMMIFVFVHIPILFVELSFIRSTYKLLKYRPKGIIKICYIISSILTFFSCVFFALIFLGAFPELTSLNSDENVIILFSGTPTFIISFILGSLPVKKYKSDSIS